MSKKYRITIKDLILRTKIELFSNFRYLFNVKKKGNFLVSSDYKLVFYDNFEQNYQLKWESGEKWWGHPYHPDFLTQWYDSEQISRTEEGLVFSAVVKPRKFSETITIPNAIGLARSREAWKYGIFSFSVKLPEGSYLWPALWLSGVKNWPPEIDLLESYSDSTVDYHKNKKLNSNFHMKDGETGNYESGARSHRLPNATTKQFIDYTIWWEKDFIKLYYNDYLVRHITDKEILDGMFEAQRIIIGTGTQKKFTKDNITPFIINNVTVYQKSQD